MRFLGWNETSGLRVSEVDDNYLPLHKAKDLPAVMVERAFAMRRAMSGGQVKRRRSRIFFDLASAMPGRARP
jgi:hypothetical protein